MELTMEHKKVLATILFHEKNTPLPKGNTFWAVFAADIPETKELVEQGYLLEEPNPVKIGPQASFSLTEKGRATANAVPVAKELQNRKYNWREGDLDTVLKPRK